MIRIELDRIHLELLLLAGLFATFSGVVFQPEMQNGMNMIPLAAFGGVGIVGLGVLVHRRISTGQADSRSRVRAMVWFALFGATLGAVISSVVVGTPQSIALASVGAGAMFSAFGTQFGIVIKSREEAAKEAVEAILDEKNVFVTPDQLWSNGNTTSRVHEPNKRSDTIGYESEFNVGTEMKAETEAAFESESESEVDVESETETDAETDATVEATVESEAASDAESESESESDVTDGVDETDEKDDSDEDSTLDEQENDTIEQTDDPGSESWKQPTTDDTPPIPVIRSIESREYPED